MPCTDSQGTNIPLRFQILTLAHFKKHFLILQPFLLSHTPPLSCELRPTLFCAGGGKAARRVMTGYGGIKQPLIASVLL